MTRKSKSARRRQNPGKRTNPDRKPGGGGWLYGHHAVVAALQNPERRCHQLLVTADAVARLPQRASTVAPEIVEKSEIDAKLPPGAVHQGIALHADPLSPPHLLEIARSIETNLTVLLLDQVTDPQNVGAIMRSAAVFGVSAIVVPKHGAPPVTGALAKTASGAVEIVPLIEVGNLSQALDQLKENQFWCIGLDGDAETDISAASLTGRTAIVMGAEGQGLRRLTREHCDLLVKIPAAGPFGTLNVANATAVALYEVLRQKTWSEK